MTCIVSLIRWCIWWSEIVKFTEAKSRMVTSRVMAPVVRNLSTVREIWVQPLGWEDPREKGMATHSVILSRRTPWTGKPGGLQSMGLQRVLHDWVTNIFTFIGKGEMENYSIFIMQYEYLKRADVFCCA